MMSIEVVFHIHFAKSFASIATFAWITEMILQMNTATYHGNHFITDRKEIFKIYV
jgi:hypothetical protein